MTETGTITIKLEGVDFEQTERCRRIIHTLFSRGFFGVRNGNAEVHFDPLGELAKMEIHKITYMRDKPPPLLQDLLEYAKIEVTNPIALTRTTSGQPK